jgi:hypothetical protein
MSSGKKPSLILVEQIEPRILVIRGQRVILDADLAELYGTATKALNQAVKRNAGRFPVDFAFQLTTEEAQSMRSQIVTASESTASNWSQSVTTSGPRRKTARRARYKAARSCREARHGVHFVSGRAMIPLVLKGPRKVAPLLRNPFGVNVLGRHATQGSRCAATLGYPTKSLRDSYVAAICEKADGLSPGAVADCDRIYTLHPRPAKQGRIGFHVKPESES